MKKLLYYFNSWIITSYLVITSTLHQVLVWLVIGYLLNKYIQFTIPMINAAHIIDYLPCRDPDDLYEDPFDHPITFSGGGIPYTSSNIGADNSPGVKPDGNATCEDAAYNERLPGDKSLLNKELTEKRVIFLDMICSRTLTILEVTYPNMHADPNAVPDNSIKNATYMVLQKYGNVSDWVARSEVDISDHFHESHLRIALIQTITHQGTLHPMETKVLHHIATCITMLNSNEALHLSQEHFQLIFNSNLYHEIYAKYNESST